LRISPQRRGGSREVRRELENRERYFKRL